MVYVKDSVTETMGAAWFKLPNVDAANIPAFLDRRLVAKDAQRNFEGYRFRPIACSVPSSTGATTGEVSGGVPQGRLVRRDSR
jgi:hypothetical protein